MIYAKMGKLAAVTACENLLTELLEDSSKDGPNSEWQTDDQNIEVFCKKWALLISLVIGEAMRKIAGTKYNNHNEAVEDFYFAYTVEVEHIIRELDDDLRKFNSAFALSKGRIHSMNDIIEVGSVIVTKMMKQECDPALISSEINKISNDINLKSELSIASGKEAPSIFHSYTKKLIETRISDTENTVFSGYQHKKKKLFSKLLINPFSKKSK